MALGPTNGKKPNNHVNVPPGPSPPTILPRSATKKRYTAICPAPRTPRSSYRLQLPLNLQRPSYFSPCSQVFAFSIGAHGFLSIPSLIIDLEHHQQDGAHGIVLTGRQAKAVSHHHLQELLPAVPCKLLLWHYLNGSAANVDYAETGADQARALLLSALKKNAHTAIMILPSYTP
ncbi:hypothetical protein EJB05_37256, partial [Eragrostis curvula]